MKERKGMRRTRGPEGGPEQVLASRATEAPVLERRKRMSKTPRREAPRAASPADRLPETDEGTVLFNVPLPKDPATFRDLPPILIKWPYQVDYIHSYAQDSPFFAGLANGRLLGTYCPNCAYKYATPRGHCMYCGKRTEWFDLPLEGRVHTWTTCHFGSEAFLPETPFNLILVEFDGVDTLFLSRLVGVGQEDIRIGMKVRARFRRNSKFDPTDIYFVPAEGPGKSRFAAPETLSASSPGAPRDRVSR